jgi:pyruvate kinase
MPNKAFLNKERKKMKLTKIVCTIGPASESVDVLRELISSGMNVARLNFSHGTYPNHKLLMKNVRQVSKELKRPIGLLQDLQGPKIRMGELKEPVTVKSGEQVILGKGGLPVQYDLSQIVGVDQRVLIDDGLVELRVLEVKPKALVCEVVQGGLIISKKGINVPESNTEFSVFTPKDKKDLEFGLKNNVDFVAMSFVRTAGDIVEVKQFIKKHLPKGAAAPWVIAKIEKTQAVRNIDAIIEVTDGIMVARGDLGIEAQEEMVPIYQKQIIRKCLEAKKPVIVATQMLDSMMRNPRPTRAEVADVANATLDNTDAVMLSGESAYGKFPRESVKKMAAIVVAAEGSLAELQPYRKIGVEDKVLKEAITIASKKRTPIVFKSNSTDLAIQISNARQDVSIFVLTENEEVARKMVLLRGVRPVIVSSDVMKAKTFDKSIEAIKNSGHFSKDSEVVALTTKSAKSQESVVSYDLINIA